MRVDIFLGPSLPIDEARLVVPEATFHAPAAQGDLLAVVDPAQATIIGLIDGTFHQNLSVWHNEVCYLLSRGVVIYGASSMGALRAAETERFGTQGVGQIFEWYRDGTVVGDDEVALLHGDATTNYQPLSLPLVNIRASVHRAVAQGSLDEDTGERLVTVSQAIYYPERLVSVILQECSTSGFSKQQLSASEHTLTLGYIDLKAADARKLLATIRQTLDCSNPPPKPIDFNFTRSSVFETLYNLDRKIPTPRGSVSLQAIAEHVALQSPDFHRIRRAGLHRSIAVFFGVLVDIRVNNDDLIAERKALWGDSGPAADELKTWLQENAMSESDLNEYLTQEAICRKLRAWAVTTRSFDRGCRVLLDELRMDGSFQFWAQEAAEAEQVVQAWRDRPEYAHIKTESPAVLAEIHGTRVKVRIKGDAKVWADEAGFEGVESLVDTLRHLAVFNDVRQRVKRNLDALEQLFASSDEAQAADVHASDQHTTVSGA